MEQMAHVLDGTRGELALDIRSVLTDARDMQMH